MMMKFSYFKKHRGQALIESIIVLPIAALLIASIFEVALAFRAKNTLNVAAQEIVRAGTLNHALLKPMKEQATHSIVPLMNGDTYGTIFIPGTRIFNANVQMTAGMHQVNIISPTKKIFAKFKVQQPELTKGETKDEIKIKTVIPNDNLNFRSAATKQVEIAGKKQPINLQDANLLKIEFKYCHQLVVPVLNRIISSFAPISDRCWQLSQLTSKKYITLSSHAIARMQTTIYETNLPNK